MLMIRASNHANPTSMMLGWPWIGMVVNLLLVVPFPF
jgi:hypothetical protein